MNKHTKHKSDARKPKKFLRKKALAERYGVHIRTIERMWRDGRIPPPEYIGQLPAWEESKLEASDRLMVRDAPYTLATIRKIRESASA